MRRHTNTCTLVFAPIALSLIPAMAWSDILQCESGNSTIVFVNGVWNQGTNEDHEVDAKASQLELEDALALEGLPPEVSQRLAFGHLYNASDGRWPDIVETMQLDLKTDSRQILRWLGGIDVVPDDIKTYFKNKASAPQLITPKDSDVLNHILAYKDCIRKGSKVLVVPHSEGNLFANLAYESLTTTERESLRVVSVANPDNCVAEACGLTASPYTTSANDTVILGYLLNPLTPLRAPLPPNVVNGLNILDWSGHQFVLSYMDYFSNSRPKIVADIVKTEAALHSAPSSSTVTFAITGTISGVETYGNGTVMAHYFPSGAAAGNAFTFTYTFDKNAPDTDPSPTFGQYLAITNARLTFDNDLFVWDASDIGNGVNEHSIRVENNYVCNLNGATECDQYGAIATTALGLDTVSARIDLFGTTLSSIDSDALPLAPPPLALFSAPKFQVTVGNALGTVFVYGAITSFVVVAQAP